MYLFIGLPLCLVFANHEECGVYFAPSTIPGAGNGMFAGRSFRPGEEVTPGDLIVPETDLSFHNGVDDWWDLDHMWNVYSWGTDTFDGMDADALEGAGASFGIGAAINCFIPFNNMEDSIVKVDSAGLHRKSDPGAGAFTRYHDRKGFASTTIPAGMELFLSYGEEYFESKTEYQAMPLSRHYPQANRFLRGFAAFRDLISNSYGVSPSATKDLLTLIHSIKDIFQSPVLNALPEDSAVVDEIVQKGTEYVHYNRSIRTIEWLRENGSCMDNLVAGTSTIKQAGRGAFTRRPISQGEIISPLPLIHIHDKKVFDMYESQEGPYPFTTSSKRNESKPFHKQLMLNYCFGHEMTDILLCPYGVGTALINHSKNRTNARIVWSKKSTSHPEWINMHPSAWSKSQHAGLAFDLVATRDLEIGDEVLIDYGDQWDLAWQEHISNWLPPPDADSYHADYEWNEMPELLVPTVAEPSYKTFNQQLFCREIYRRWWGLYWYNGRQYPCRAIDRYERHGEVVYNVEILLRSEGTDVCDEMVEEVLFGVPRDIFFFQDDLYTRDQAQPWSFRHHMQIPDELLPEAWKTRKSRPAPPLPAINTTAFTNVSAPLWLDEIFTRAHVSTIPTEKTGFQPVSLDHFSSSLEFVPISPCLSTNSNAVGCQS